MHIAVVMSRSRSPPGFSDCGGYGCWNEGVCIDEVPGCQCPPGTSGDFCQCEGRLLPARRSVGAVTDRPVWSLSLVALFILSLTFALCYITTPKDWVTRKKKRVDRAV
eukprot:Polyplicarium_translucidae@DN1564_c0_g1_i1.p2